jgi:hypothetical protein
LVPYVAELLSALLQLADGLLYQQPSAASVAAAAVATGTTSTSHTAPQHAARTTCAQQLLVLLALVAQQSLNVSPNPSNSENSNSYDISAAPVEASAVCKRLVEVAAALEAALRAVAAGVQSSSTLNTNAVGLAMDHQSV